jgi:hypothetical protein
MHIKIPIIAFLIVSSIQLAVYGIQNNKYSKKDFAEILTVQQGAITTIRISDLAGRERYTQDPAQMEMILDYFAQFRYQRLMNDQTAFMPSRTSTVYLDAGDDTVFIVPYGKEVIIDHRVYRVRGGMIEQQFLTDMFQVLSGDG